MIAIPEVKRTDVYRNGSDQLVIQQDDQLLFFPIEMAQLVAAAIAEVGTHPPCNGPTNEGADWFEKRFAEIKF